jgi:signal transduction histidine kinase
MFDRMRIRVKLLLALAIPLLALVGLSSFVVALSDQQASDAAARADSIDYQVSLATASLGPQGVVGAIQTERNSEAIALAGVSIEDLGGESEEAGMVAPGKARNLTDQAIASFKARVAGSPAAVQAIYRPAVDAVDTVPVIRNDIDTSTEAPGIDSLIARRTFKAYSAIVKTLFDANSKTSLVVDDANLRNGAALIDLVSRLREDGSDVTYVMITSGLPITDVATARTVAETRTRELVREETIRNTAIGPYKAIVERGLDDDRTTSYREIVRQLFVGESSNVFSLMDPHVSRIWGALSDLDHALGDQLNKDAAAVRGAAQQEAIDAQQRQRNVVFMGIAALLAAAAVSYAAARSISRPLLRLARSAEDMAEHRLPGAVKEILETPAGDDVVIPDLEPVPAGGGAEIHEVAKALNSVQDSALNLAVEQTALRRNIADSFVNLGRRNQNLLSRQIDSITEMEHDEADPRTLERLFKLDHLATRMRRNAESLLLLGGQEPHRQWSAPVPLIQIIRGAMGEVEDYQRITIRDLDEAMIKGSTAADVTHLVAELLENALRFSPPNREVEIIGRAAEGDYSLAIVDAGLGMNEDDLAQANRRLSGSESFTVAPSRYLGHYVVGVQAARLGVEVHLQNSPGSGVTARIQLGETLTDAPVPPAAAPVVQPAPADEIKAVPEPRSARHTFVDEPAVERFVPPAPAVEPVAPAPVAPVARTTAQAEVTTSPTAQPAVTASGYKRRQRGTHAPRTEVTLARGEVADAADDQPVDKADSVRSLLTELQAGADRARAESSGAASIQEDLRERS